MGIRFNPLTDIPDLSEKTIVVTGGNAGLGAQTIRDLAEHNPKRIYLCARALESACRLIADIKEKHPSAQIEPIFLDLSLLSSAKAAAKAIISGTDRLHLLFLNAGVAGTKPALTADGYEWQFGVNYLAHAMFTALLLPLMLRTAGENGGGNVRVITVASEAAQIFAPSQGLVLKEVKNDMSTYGGMTRYGHSKLANILFARKLAQTYPSIRSVAIHPGLVKSNNHSKADGAGWFSFIWRPMLVLTGVTVQEGVKTQLWAATAADAQSGKFYMPLGREDAGGKYGSKQELMDELWSWTEAELLAHGGPGWPSVVSRRDEEC